MGRWLAAIAKGLSYAAGPFKPVVDFLLKLYDGELAEKADKKIQQMIHGQQDVLDEIVDILHEIRRSDKVLGVQLANGTEAFIELIQTNKIKVFSPEQLEDIVNSQFFVANVKEFWKNGFVDVNTIEMECVKIFGASDVMYQRFLMCVRSGGFNAASLSQNYSKEANISECIRQTFSDVYDSSTRKNIIAHLLDEGAPGSEILHNAHELLTN